MNQVLMPKMGDTMEEGKLLSWHKQVGDAVQKGDALAEIETEKTNIEVESFATGVLRQILVQEGETVPVGTPIALVGDPSEALEGAGQSTVSGAAAGRQSAPPAPATSAPPAPATVGASGGRPASTGVASATPLPRMGEGQGVGATNGHANGASAGARIFISPIARRIAAEHDLDIAQVHGSGPGGRIIREDVEAALSQQTAAPAPMPAAAVSEAPLPRTGEGLGRGAAPGEEVRAVPLSQMRKTIAKRLQQSMQTVPHFYMTMAIDATRLGELRESINGYAAGLPQPIKVSLNDLIIKGVALALRQVPEVNASFDTDQILYKQRINIGVAVALDRGLIVPVVRDADTHGVLDIARETRRLIDAARANTLKPEEFQGGTFTVSNAGMYGVESFTAVINPPEAAILAVGAAVPSPVVVDGQVVVREMMRVTLSS
ncbi:MAG TPA: dihydrolipoamide acetyltransferase family protein, partial [Ktedonobacterales bacterium]